MRSSRSDRADPPAWLTARPYAHRGLHGPDVLENSRAAFEAAIAAGYGIELDVQASRDGTAMVFHDDALDRLTAEAGRLFDRTAAALARVRLNGLDETVPTLGDILRLVAGRAPLLIELKAPNRRVVPLCRSVRDSLRTYAGEAAVMSFNPEVGRWFARHAPGLPRGLVVTEQGKRGLRGRIERHLALRRSGADFLAYDIRDLPSSFAARQRGKGLKVLTWTVRTPRDAETAAAHADQIIHELPRG